MSIEELTGRVVVLVVVLVLLYVGFKKEVKKSKKK